jgi:tRNA modification GTPase
MTDTIYALASGGGRAGVAVYRLSGAKVGSVLQALLGKSLPPPRHASLARILDERGEGIDDGLVLWFPAPASFTGEDVAELHLHGGRAVARALFARLAELGLRPAEAGEFSRRAFANGKLDLTRAEAIADLVDAETDAQRKQALRQMEGGLARLVEGWRSELVAAQALMEAEIDFSDEGLPTGLLDQVAVKVAGLKHSLAAHLGDDHRGERLRDGIHIAILGAPNAGKSSLLNRLAGREAAIVSAHAGTTRDVVEVHLDLGGLPVVVADTAGLREAACDIEAEGIRRALAKAESADLKLAVFGPDHLDEATLAVIDDATLVVMNKRDLATAAPPTHIKTRPVFAISARHGDGVEDLVAALARAVGDRFTGGNDPVLTRARHRAAVEQGLAALARCDLAGPPELAAEDLRLAARALGRITGAIDSEEILDAIFRDFCIGK